MTTTQTTIERSVDIDAPATTVWRIISEPGWWVNDGALTPHRIEPAGDDVWIVHDPTHGPFRITTVALEEPRYAAFRWHPTAPDDPSTLTEFRIEPRASGVTLTVVESDFDSLVGDARHAFLRDNTEGWELELGLAKRAAEQA
jgi:uncharacterized protein YndB with AHSA1/START domain